MLMTPLLWAKLAVLGGLVAFGAWQTVRLASERTAHGETRVAFAEHRTMAERASRVQSENFAAQASSWRKTQLENANANRIVQDEILGQLAGERSARERLRDRYTALAATAGQAPRDPGAQPAGQAASSPADLLAHMLDRIDEAASGIGEFAERSHAAGELCVGDYDSLTSPMKP